MEWRKTYHAEKRLMLRIDGLESHADFESVFLRRKRLSVKMIFEDLGRSEDDGGSARGVLR